MTRQQSSTSISTKLLRIARMAKEHPTRAFTNLAHHIDLPFLHEAYRLRRKDGATGVDGVTGEDYERDLQGNLERLLDQFKSGRYRAPDVRRVHIPKGDGRTRPLGIPTFEDKVLQRAVAMILGAVYEQDFLPCSYGFRPGRSAHDAIADSRQGLMDLKGGWVVEADIRDCFGTIDRPWLRKILGRRIRDGVLMRQIGKWLNAGVLEDGQRTRPDVGTPQGGVISPILSNIFLHDVLDVWFERTVRPQLRGRARLIRYADDFVLLCEHESDARRIYAALPDRFGRFGLDLHPEKTRLIRFTKPPYRAGGGGNVSQSWDFLGFTHYWTRSRRGYWVIKQKTAASRLSRSLKAIGAWCRRNRHVPVRDQHRTLSMKLRGHCEYYGITGNSTALRQFRTGMAKLWRRWLMRRSGGAARKNWAWWNAFEERHRLPPAHAVKSVLRRT
jgi:group II intron reverse transcriptase/maturase